MLNRLEAKHWALLAGCLMAMSVTIGGLDTWSDALKPAIVAGLLGQLAVLIGAVFTGAPPDPSLNVLNNPGRREDDPAPSMGTVSEATRRNLP